MTNTPEQRTKELLPCPFCGGAVELDEIERDDNLNPPRPHRVYVIECSCGASVECTSGDFWIERTPPESDEDRKAKSLVVERWNRRQQLSAANAEIERLRGALEAKVKHLVDRFLNWQLPEDFYPDAGISFDRPSFRGTLYPMPVGTNLLTATQAEQMVRHMLDGVPPVIAKMHPRKSIARGSRVLVNGKWYTVTGFVLVHDNGAVTGDVFTDMPVPGKICEPCLGYRIDYNDIEDVREALSNTTPSPDPKDAVIAELVGAWDKLPEGNYTASVVQHWIIHDMWPAIKKARALAKQGGSDAT